MKRILVTGGAGFLGSHLCKSLIEKGQFTNKKSKLIFKPLPKDGSKQSMPDTTITQEKLAWSPTTQFEHGLFKTIEYLKNTLNAF